MLLAMTSGWNVFSGSWAGTVKDFWFISHCWQNIWYIFPLFLLLKTGSPKHSKGFRQHLLSGTSAKGPNHFLSWISRNMVLYLRKEKTYWWAWRNRDETWNKAPLLLHSILDWNFRKSFLVAAAVQAPLISFQFTDLQAGMFWNSYLSREIQSIQWFEHRRTNW